MSSDTRLTHRVSCRVICFGSLEQGDLSSTIIPWGFVSQQKVSESVRPDRAGDGPGDDGRVEKRAEHLNLDTWEFLRVRHFLSISGCWLFPPPFPCFDTLMEKHTYLFDLLFPFFCFSCVFSREPSLPTDALLDSSRPHRTSGRTHCHSRSQQPQPQLSVKPVAGGNAAAGVPWLGQRRGRGEEGVRQP